MFNSVSSRSITPFSAVQNSILVAKPILEILEKAGCLLLFFLSLRRLQPGRQSDSTIDVIQAKYNPEYVDQCMIYANGGKVLLLNGWLLSSFGGVPGYQGRWKSKEPLSQGSYFFQRDSLSHVFPYLYLQDSGG